MINIVLPLAGRGSRFATAGYELPKPLIDVAGRPMIEVVVNNLRPVCEHRFIFICQQEHIEKYRLDTILLGAAPGAIIVPVDHITDGQLSSALLAESWVDNDIPLITANTDQYIDFDINSYVNKLLTSDLDGVIMTMKANDPKWSFVKLDENNLVRETAEKRVISNQATVGVYGFARGSDFVRAAHQMINKNLRVNGEFYICPCYNELLAEGKKIGIFEVGSERAGMYGLGIPEDLEFFLSEFHSKKGES